jgi:hypothetical protein
MDNGCRNKAAGGERSVNDAWKFVILRHSGVEKEHFDLMIQAPGEELLWTWRIEEEPAGWGTATRAERIADHRAAYMTYQGAVSGGRGRVERVAEGRVEVLEEDQALFHVRLCGERESCEISLPRQSAG